ncbi:MAG: Holliday junction DNA helicase RuvB C-terminal domain-containing protein [Planctomycetota bacterium]
MPRPVPTFHDFIGHVEVVARLRRQAEGARTRQKPFPHTLFTGTSGLGKTLLAEALATEFETDFIKIYGEIPEDELVNRLIALPSHAFLFIDEAHSLKTSEQELLFKSIDHLRVPNPNGAVTSNASHQKTEETTEIMPFTLLLATDRPGKLLNPLHKRMVLQVALSHYSIAELKEIVDRMATDMDMLVSPQAAKLIAQISGGLPRRAEHVLKNILYHFPNSEGCQLSIPQIREFMEDFGIDNKGLGPQELMYLSYLKDVGSASLESMALCLGLDCDFVHRQVEPLLLRERLVKIGPGGRKLTPIGLDWINQLNNNRKDPSTNGQNQSGQANP